MKQITVKTISELTQDEINEFLKNKSVRDEIIEHAQFSEEIHVSEILDYIKDGLESYSIGAFSSNNHMDVDTNKIDTFINGMNKLQDHFLLIDVLGAHELLKEAETIYNEYIFSDMFSDAYNELESTLLENTSELANALLAEMVTILEYFSDFKTVENESDYIDIYLELHYDTEVAITEKGVTFINY